MGVNDKLFSPQLRSSYSTISVDELMTEVIPDYCIENPIECLFWERGANDTYQIRCPEENYFLRICRHNAFPPEANQFEAECLDYLHRNGFSVAYPIQRKSGGFIKEVVAAEGSRYVLVTSLAKGEVPDYGSLENCYLVGKSVAQLHNVSDGFATSYKRNDLDLAWLLESSMSVIRSFIKDLPEKIDLIDEIVKKVKADINNISERSLDFGICHGDLHGGNLHLHEGKITHFDFEECAFGYRLYDLATFKWGVCRGENASKRWDAFINGYKSNRPLSKESLALIGCFVVMREMAETAYGIRHVQDFGYNGIMATDIDEVCKNLIAFLSTDKS